MYKTFTRFVSTLRSGDNISRLHVVSTDFAGLGNTYYVTSSYRVIKNVCAPDDYNAERQK
jgi:hypothetical protein